MRPTRHRAIIWLTAAGLLAGTHHLNAAQERTAAAPSASEEAAVLASAIDAVAAGKQSVDAGLGWKGNHFIRSQGESVYIPFTISLGPRQVSTPVSVYIRAVSRSAPPSGAPKYPWETLQPADVPADGLLSRAIALTPGSYDIFVAVKERGVTPGKVGVVRHELTVPPFPAADLTTSSIILARSLEQLPSALSPDKQQDNPYVFGPLKVTPSSDSAFPKSGELQVLFWIYGAAQTAGKPDVQVDFSFYQRSGDGEEKYFNKTNPQELNIKTLPTEFNLAMGHQLLSSLSVPLATFPPGRYRLEIKVTDKPSGKSLTNNVNFEVSAS
jgi:hypothetical protein